MTVINMQICQKQIPCFQNPFRIPQPVKICCLTPSACDPICVQEGFELDTRELQREGVSFTVDTVREFLAERPDVRFHYLIGADSVGELHTWKDAETLVSLVRFVVLARGVCDAAHLFGGREATVVARRIEISSTEIRRRVASGRSVRYLVPDAVAGIIEREGLYR